MKKMRISLAWQIVIALFLGILVGAFLHNSPELRNDIVANFLQPLGLKTIVYFEIITTVAIIVGLVAANVFQPGAGIDMSTLTTSDISQYKETTQEVSHEAHGLVNTVLSLIPPNIFAAMSDGHMLPVIFFAVIFGIGLGSLSKETKQPLIDVLKAVSETMFKVTHMIMMFAPFVFIALIKLAVLVYAAILFFIFIVLGLVAKFCGFSVWTIIKILKDELILAYSTASSETVLPRMMEKMEAYGAPKSITSFVVPIGYSFNLDGSTLYQSIAAIFIAQLYGIDLTITQQIVLVLTLMITSKGIAVVGIPLEGLAFIAGIDRILDMARTVLNVIGNALAVLVISKWEGKFDTEKQKSYNFDATH
ncbi:hypothetical protein FQR65_LT16372 [Abscondita terminalis]|nr:hypothetical protein FQR65_LT16372 [Abscondita terminalis]